jgi:hypothetical protein
MDFRLIDSGWDKELDTALLEDRSTVRIVCPFIKRRAAERLLKRGHPESLQVITRFNLDDFSEGVSDIDALASMLKTGARIRGVRNLHAKIYLFGARRAIVTSANLTEAALLRNHEFGFVTEDSGIVRRCGKYFDDLWGRAGRDLTPVQLANWKNQLAEAHARSPHFSAKSGLPDEGTDVGKFVASVPVPPWVEDAQQAFVKFLGEGHDRALASKSILDEVKDSGCHWACAYPRKQRPRSVEDGALMFMGRLTSEPQDIFIFGRAVGLRHVEGRDDATAGDIRDRPWKDSWPRYIRVHHPEFVSGSLSHGVSMNKLMDIWKHNAFTSTQRNAANRFGNMNPRQAYRQKPAVELTPEAHAWLNQELEAAFILYGKLSASELASLDWPLLRSEARKNTDEPV